MSDKVYNEAQDLLIQGDYLGAAAKFESLRGYSDSAQMALYCKAISMGENGIFDVCVDTLQGLGEFKDAPQMAVYYAARSYEAGAAAIDVSTAGYADLKEGIWRCDTAIEYYNKNLLYLDSLTRIAACQSLKEAFQAKIYDTAKALMDAGQYEKAIEAFTALNGYADSWAQIEACKEASLKADGTVVAVGSNQYGQCDVSGWQDIVAVSAGWYHTVGLKADGTVVAAGLKDSGQCDVSQWTDIVAITAGGGQTIGLKADGTVVATKYTGDRKYYNGECDVTGWNLFN